MKPETLTRELLRVAAELEAHELPTTRPARVRLLREAVAGQVAEAGFLAQQIASGMLAGIIPCNLVLHQICQAALDRWLGRAAISVDARVSGVVVQLSGSDLARSWREQLPQQRANGEQSSQGRVIDRILPPSNSDNPALRQARSGDTPPGGDEQGASKLPAVLAGEAGEARRRSCRAEEEEEEEVIECGDGPPRGGEGGTIGGIGLVTE